MVPAPKPMISAPMTLTNPEAGVMATSPATAPQAAPITLGWPLRHQETVIHVKAPMAAAVLVTRKALVARAPAVRALPALKPNQPNQSRAAPRTTMGVAWGSIFSWPNT